MTYSLSSSHICPMLIYHSICFQESSLVIETPDDETTLDSDGDSVESISDEPLTQAQIERNLILSHAKSTWAYIEAAHGWSEDRKKDWKKKVYGGLGKRNPPWLAYTQACRDQFNFVFDEDATYRPDQPPLFWDSFTMKFETKVTYASFP
jgi:hypothetical protein